MKIKANSVVLQQTLTTLNYETMKRLGLFLVFVFITGIAIGQRNNRTSAFNYLRNGKLDRAKEFIDKTIEHPTTKEDAKAWFYRGNIYLSIHMSDIPEYKALDDNALETALEAYQKAQEYDKSKEFYTDILTNLFVISEQYYILGVDAYNSKSFKDAMHAFQHSVVVSEMMGSADTMALYNVALTAELASENEVAEKSYKDLMKMGFNTPEVFVSLSKIYMAKGDTVGGLNYIKEGREIHPDDFNLLINEINVYLLTGDVEKALENLEIAVTKDDTNPTIFFAVGVAYDQLRSKYSDSGSEYFAKAEESYKKAIDLNPEYFDAVYNLGALYVNSAAILIEEANKLPLSEQEKYDELLGQANKYLELAMPTLEKAIELQPDDFSTMVSLKEIYTRMNEYDKLKEINKKIEMHQSKD